MVITKKHKNVCPKSLLVLEALQNIKKFYIVIKKEEQAQMMLDLYWVGYKV